MADNSPAKLPVLAIDTDTNGGELNTDDTADKNNDPDSQHEQPAPVAQPAAVAADAVTPYVSPLTICNLPTDAQYMIVSLLNVFDVARLVTALGEPLERAACLYLSHRCRHFIAFPFSELDRARCLRDNYSVLTVAANHIEEMTITYVSINHSVQVFNRMLKSAPLTRLRRLNITQNSNKCTLRCPNSLESGMEFPTLFGLEELKFSHFKSAKLMGELIAMNTATLRVLEFDDVPELNDLPPLPEFLTQLMLRNVQSVAIDTLVHCLANRVTHRGLTHFEYTAAVPADASRTNTAIQYRKMFDVLRDTVHTMTVDSWLLPFALDKRNTVVRVLCVQLTKFILRLEQTLDRVTEQMTGLEHLTIFSCHKEATFEGEPGQYAELFGRLKSLTLVNCAFLGDDFMRYVRTKTKLTLRTEAYEPIKSPLEQLREMNEHAIQYPGNVIFHPYALPPGGQY